MLRPALSSVGFSLMFIRSSFNFIFYVISENLLSNLLAAVQFLHHIYVRIFIFQAFALRLAFTLFIYPYLLGVSKTFSKIGFLKQEKAIVCSLLGSWWRKLAADCF